MHVIWTLIVGLLVGGLVRSLTPGRGGTLLTLVVGMAGAVLAGIMVDWIGAYQLGSGRALITSAFGAMVLLHLHRRLQR